MMIRVERKGSIFYRRPQLSSGWEPRKQGYPNTDARRTYMREYMRKRRDNERTIQLPSRKLWSGVA